jgi:predicted dehydrogenase
MKKIKTGVIGLGFIGVAHVEALRRLNLVEVEAVTDDASVIQSKAKVLGVNKYYSDYKKILADPEIDCIHICTPNNLHYTMARDALNAGKHVVCEKPLTTSSREAEELVKLASDKKLVNATNFNVRFYPLIHQMKSVIQSGEFGNIFSVHGSYLQDWLFYPTDYNWRLETELSGDSRAVADIGSHWMDLAEFVTGLQITEVMADFATFHHTRKKPLKPVETYTGKLLTPEDYQEVPISTEDYATILIRFNNGGHGALTISQVFAGKKNQINMEIAGSKKSVSWNSERPNEIWLGSRDSANELLMKDPSLLGAEAQEISSFPGGHNEGFPDTFKQLFIKIYSKIAGIKTEIEYPTFEAGLREIRLCEKIIESNQSKSWIKI